MEYKNKTEAKLMQIYHSVNYTSDYSVAKIHPNSYHILEPQEGDKNIDGYVFDAKLKAWKKFTVMTPLDEGVYNMKPPHELPISERNGKAFIMPERE